MSSFLTEILAFPTIVFTLVLALAIIYWLAVLAGVADIAALHGGAADDLAREPRPADASDAPRAPVAIRLSAFALFGWVGSFLIVHNVVDDPTNVGVALSFGAATVGVLAGAAMARLVSRPVARLLAVDRPVTSGDLVGRECTVSTGEVTMTFGQARIEEGGADLIVHIRCEPGRLGRGDRAMVVDHDASDGVYTVEPLGDLLGVPDTPRDLAS